LELNNDVYEEVVKPFLEQTKPQVEFGLTAREPPNSSAKKRTQINFDCEYVEIIHLSMHLL
jgi:hypothetical protein